MGEWAVDAIAKTICKAACGSAGCLCERREQRACVAMERETHLVLAAIGITRDEAELLRTGEATVRRKPRRKS